VAEVTFAKQADLAVRLRQHIRNFKEGLLEKSKLAKHPTRGHRVISDEAMILEIESNSRYRKYKKPAHMAYLKTPIRQPILDLSHLDPPYQR
jgi:hypothetical protein